MTNQELIDEFKKAAIGKPIMWTSWSDATRFIIPIRVNFDGGILCFDSRVNNIINYSYIVSSGFNKDGVTWKYFKGDISEHIPKLLNLINFG